jgi:hypothetical protein
MTRKRLRIILIINTVVCLLAILPAFAMQMATVMGGASPGAGELGAFIAMMGLVLPSVLVISIAGSWIAMRWTRVSLAFVALPWIYSAAFAATLVVFFSR